MTYQVWLWLQRARRHSVQPTETLHLESALPTRCLSARLGKRCSAEDSGYFMTLQLQRLAIVCTEVTILLARSGARLADHSHWIPQPRHRLRLQRPNSHRVNSLPSIL